MRILFLATLIFIFCLSALRADTIGAQAAISVGDNLIRLIEINGNRHYLVISPKVNLELKRINSTETGYSVRVISSVIAQEIISASLPGGGTLSYEIPYAEGSQHSYLYQKFLELNAEDALNPEGTSKPGLKLFSPKDLKNYSDGMRLIENPISPFEFAGLKVMSGAGVVGGFVLPIMAAQMILPPAVVFMIYLVGFTGPLLFHFGLGLGWSQVRKIARSQFLIAPKPFRYFRRPLATMSATLAASGAVASFGVCRIVLAALRSL